MPLAAAATPTNRLLNQSNVGELTLSWQYTTQPGGAAPVYADGIVFTSDYSGTLYAINAATGALMWSSQPTVNGTWGTSSATANGVVYLDSIPGSAICKVDSGIRRTHRRSFVEIPGWCGWCGRGFAR